MPAVWTSSALNKYHPPKDTPVRLIDTAVPGSSLAASNLLVLRAPAGGSAPSQVFITPDGTKLIGGTSKIQSRPRNGIERGALSEASPAGSNPPEVTLHSGGTDGKLRSSRRSGSQSQSLRLKTM